MVEEENLTDEEIERFERVLNHFESMTVAEQKTYLKMLIFEWLECERNCKGRDKKYWEVQRQTYEMMIHLFTDTRAIGNMRTFLFNQVEKDYERIFESSVEA